MTQHDELWRLAEAEKARDLAIQEASRQAREALWFGARAKLHQSEGKPEDDEKATRNWELAKEMAAAWRGAALAQQEVE